jgi:CheY-like chemotaxis protein
MQVLITDDSATIRMILKGLLKQLQITDIREAGDGAEALTAVDALLPDLLLLDIHMPGMDGLTCLSVIRSTPRTANLPVIIISSDTAPEQVKKAEEMGAFAYIKKPFRLEGLKEALKSVFPNRHD